MRNVAVVGQALPPIEFPYHKEPAFAWSRVYPDYARRMKAMSEAARRELKNMHAVDEAFILAA